MQELGAVLSSARASVNALTNLDEQRPSGAFWPHVPVGLHPPAGSNTGGPMEASPHAAGPLAGAVVGALAPTTGQLSTARLLASIAVEPPVLTRGALPGLAALVLKARRGSPLCAAWDEGTTVCVATVGWPGTRRSPAPHPPWARSLPRPWARLEP